MNFRAKYWKIKSEKQWLKSNTVRCWEALSIEHKSFSKDVLPPLCRVQDPDRTLHFEITVSESGETKGILPILHKLPCALTYDTHWGKLRKRFPEHIFVQNFEHSRSAIATFDKFSWFEKKCGKVYNWIAPVCVTRTRISRENITKMRSFQLPQNCYALGQNFQNFLEYEFSRSFR